MILQKYFAALLSITIVVLSALIAIPSGRLDLAAALQIASIGVAAVVTYISPLVNINWKGILKTGAAILAAIFSIGYPIAVTHGTPTPVQIGLMVLAGLNALGVEVGVQIRTDTSALLPVDTTPTISLTNSDIADIVSSAAHASASAAVNAVTPAPSLNVGGPVAPAEAPVPDVPAAEPETEIIDNSEKPDPGIPELFPVDTAPNPANSVDDLIAATSTINTANLVSE